MTVSGKLLRAKVTGVPGTQTRRGTVAKDSIQVIDKAGRVFAIPVISQSGLFNFGSLVGKKTS